MLQCPFDATIHARQLPRHVLHERFPHGHRTSPQRIRLRAKHPRTQARTPLRRTCLGRRQQWKLGRIGVDARFSRDESGTESITRTITITETLSDEQVEKLAEIAEKTPVTKTVKRGTAITTTISRT